jgi:hypothetical protein
LPDLGRATPPPSSTVMKAPLGVARTSIPEAATAQERPYAPEHDLGLEPTRALLQSDCVGSTHETLPPPSSPGAQVVPGVGRGAAPSCLNLGETGRVFVASNYICTLVLEKKICVV